MHDNLRGKTLELREQLAKKLITERSERIIDIYKISYLAFYINFKYSENTLFSLSLYELNYKLKDRKQGLKSKVKELDLIN
jgi:hypothetical protein